MQFFPGTLQELALDAIDPDNEYFRMSRKVPDENLALSIRNFGILFPPLVAKRGGSHVIIFGHNRITTARKTGMLKITACVVDEPDPTLFVHHVILKAYKKEIGLAGKFRALNIFKEYFGFADAKIAEIATKAFGLGDLVEKAGAFSRLPQIVKDYLDTKEIHARTVRLLLSLPHECIEQISGWIGCCAFSAASFKELVTLVHDIYRRDSAAPHVDDEKISACHSSHAGERILQSLYETRYPDYFSMKKKAGAITSFFSQRGINVSYPDYFEGDHITITFRLGKRDTKGFLKKKFEEIDEEKLRELISLL